MPCGIYEASSLPDEVGFLPRWHKAKLERSKAGARVSRQYTYNWQTKTSWSGTCRMFTIQFKDGTSQSLVFQFG